MCVCVCVYVCVCVNMRIGKALTAIDHNFISKYDLTDKIKQDFFQGVAVSVLLHGCTTSTLMKHLEKKLYGNYTRMLFFSWKKHTTKQWLYGHLPPILQIIKDEQDMRNTTGEN